MHQNPFDKLAVPKLVNKISAFYGTRSLIVLFIKACYLLFFSESAQFIPSIHPVFLRSILILTSLYA